MLFRLIPVRVICTFVIFSLAAFASIALTTGALADGGDEYATAVDLTGQFPGVFTGDTTDNTDRGNEECPYSDTGGADEWWAYTADADFVWTFDLCGSSYDTKIYIYDTDDGWALVGCNDDSTSCEEDGRSKIWVAPFVTGHRYVIVVDGFDSSAFGPYEMIVSDYEPCEPDCPPDGIDEGEPECQDEYVDEFNSGCNYTGSGDFPFSTMACGEIICGVSGTYTATVDGEPVIQRDTDWYEVEVSGTPGQCYDLTLAGIAEFPMQFLIIHAGDLSCDPGTYTIIASGQGDPCSTLEVTRLDAPQATYWLWVGPAVFDAFWQCPVDYVVSLDCAEGNCIGDIDCPPDSIPEGEPICYTDYYDAYNPGCNVDPPIFQDIECNTTVCGTSGTYEFFDGGMQTTYRDMDWFTFTTDYVGKFKWEVTAEYPLAIWFMEAGSGNCEDYDVLDFTSGSTPGKTYETSVEEALPGEYWVIQAPSDWDWYPCGLEWYGTLSCDEDVFCDLLCEDGATAEGEEQCYTGYVDETNGGCYVDTFAEGSISLGATICGYTGVYEIETGTTAWDSDWYAFTSAGEVITFTLMGERKMAGYIIKPGGGSDPCEGFSIVDEGVIEACEALELTATLEEGEDYWFVVYPMEGPTWPYPCDTLYNCTLTDITGPDCPADITGADGAPDGEVDVLDLIVVLARWGTADPDADITGPAGEPDGVVDVLDLVQLLSAWGPC